MTIAVDWDVKHQTKQTNNQNKVTTYFLLHILGPFHSYVLVVLTIFRRTLETGFHLVLGPSASVSR